MSERTTIFILLVAIVLQGCGGTAVQSNPVKEMKQQFNSKKAYTILLEDMDLSGEQYKHKYKLLEVLPDQKVDVSITDWKNISDDFYNYHQDDLGMELLSKNEANKLNNLVSPPGFTNFIGNEKYGSWSESDVDSLSQWKFNATYAHLERDLGVKGLPIYRTEYQTYRDKYLFNRPFYGTQVVDSTKYGTRSRHCYFMYGGFYSRRILHNNFRKRNSTRTTHGGFRGGGGFGK